MIRSAPSLAGTIREVFGLPAGELVDAEEIQMRALEFNPASWNLDNSRCSHYLARYPGREDVFLAAAEHGCYAPGSSDVYHFFVNSVLAAVPFRHESFVVEVEAPHRLWFQEYGKWKCVAGALFGEEPDGAQRAAGEAQFYRRVSQADWIFPLLPGWEEMREVSERLPQTGETWTARNVGIAQANWRRDGAPDGAALTARWEASAKQCGDGLLWLWGCFFLGDAARLAEAQAALAHHPSAAARSAARMTGAGGSGSARFDGYVAEMRRRWLDGAIEEENAVPSPRDGEKVAAGG